MKKVININFHGQVIAIEETAYETLEQYIGSLKTYFSQEEGGDEIVNDIECRIAELFGNRLKHGINCITDEDVQAVIDSIGRPQEFDSNYEEETSAGEEFRSSQSSQSYQSIPPGEAAYDANRTGSQQADRRGQSLYRNTGEQIIGGVCSGLAHYLKTDPVWIRLLFVVFFGFLFWVYIVLWIVLTPKVLESNVSRRLYRNPGDRIIGGVCGGIAAYFRIEAWIPRVLFLLPLLLNLIGPASVFPMKFVFSRMDFNWNINLSMGLIYIILWIIIPAARSVKQKLEMMGEEEYIRSIREKVNDNVASSRNRTGNDDVKRPGVENREAYNAAIPGEVGGHSISGVAETPVTEEMPPEPPVPPVSDRRAELSPQPQRSGCLNILVVFSKIIFFSVVGIFLLSLIAMLVGLLVTSTQLSQLKMLFIDPGHEDNLLFIALGLLFAVPIISVIIWIIRRSMKAKSRPAIGIIAALLWFAGLIISGVLAGRIADKFSVESLIETNVSLSTSTSSTMNAGRMYVEMQPYGGDYEEFKTGYGPGTKIEELPYTNIDRDSLLFRNIHLEMGKSSDSLFHVRVISATRGKDLRSAMADLRQFSYNITQQDSLLLLPEFFSVPIEQGFRCQSITVEILVPAGKTVEMSEALSDYMDNSSPEVVRKRIRKLSRNSSYMPVTVSEEGEVLIVPSTDSI